MEPYSSDAVKRWKRRYRHNYAIIKEFEPKEFEPKASEFALIDYESVFERSGSQIRIPGAWYTLQLVRIGDKWAFRLIHGAVIASSFYDDAELSGSEYPIEIHIASWVLRTVSTRKKKEINHRKLMKRVHILVKQAINKRDDNMDNSS